MIPSRSGILGLLTIAATALVAASIPVGGAKAQSPAGGGGVTIDTRQAASIASQRAVQDLMQRAQSRGEVRVIVGLDLAMRDESELTSAQEARQVRALQSIQTNIARRTGLSVGKVVNFETIPFMSVFVTPSQLRALLNDPQVVSIQEDVPDRPFLADSVPLIQANRVWRRGFSGQGWVVAILDTGSDDRHPMLRNKLVAALCRSTTSAANKSESVCPGGVAASNTIRSGRPCSSTIDGCFHGTHVASIAVGNSSVLKGVARGAQFIAAQVFSKFAADSGFCIGANPCALSYTSDQVSALERILRLSRQFMIASVNMSLGGGAFAAYCDASQASRAAIINKLTRRKVAVAIASGNEGNNGFISAPACIKKAVAVGSTTKQDAVSSFSNHSTLVDIMAPGSSINAALPGNQYGILSGTSMATPHIAGVFAMLRQAHPNQSIGDILKAMQRTGVPVARAGITKRRVRVLNALNRLDTLFP